MSQSSLSVGKSADSDPDEARFSSDFRSAFLVVTGDALPQTLSMDSSFSELDLDSLDRLEILEILAESWGVVIDDLEISKLTFPKDLMELLSAKARELRAR